jgi:hypothetical protein
MDKEETKKDLRQSFAGCIVPSSMLVTAVRPSLPSASLPPCRSGDMRRRMNDDTRSACNRLEILPVQSPGVEYISPYWELDVESRSASLQAHQREAAHIIIRMISIVVLPVGLGH